MPNGPGPRPPAKEWGIGFATDDYRDLIARDDVEVVNVCTPPDSHAELTIASLEAGKHVVCEKPLALDLQEAKAMARAAETARVKYPQLIDAVHHEMRYLPFRRMLRDLVTSGYLGEVRYAIQTVAVDYGVNPGMEPYWYTWVARKEQGGGFLTGMFSHEIDLLRHTLGDLHDVHGTVSIAVRDKPVLAWEYRDGDDIGPDSPTDRHDGRDGRRHGGDFREARQRCTLCSHRNVGGIQWRPAIGLRCMALRARPWSPAAW